jgi:hypothetical protein
LLAAGGRKWGQDWSMKANIQARSLNDRSELRTAFTSPYGIVRPSFQLRIGLGAALVAPGAASKIHGPTRAVAENGRMGQESGV